MFDVILAATSPATSAPGSKSLTLILFIIVVALIFDFLNGFHDAANSIATIVSTRVLSPIQAVAWAAFFNFVAAFVFGTGVAKTIGTGLVQTTQIDIYVVLGGLIGAIAWNIITWILALPTSSSHALLGGVAGAAVTKAGMGVLIWQGWAPIVIFLFLAPVIGLLLGMGNMILLSWLCRRATPRKVDWLFRKLQLVSAGIYSLSHGGNDAQKTMGIIVMVLTVAGYQHATEHDPGSVLNFLNVFNKTHHMAWWIILSCHAAIALGTMFGGWRIVKTMGSGITKLQPIGGFAAETAAALTIIGATELKVPISTTHAITGAILGVGSTRTVRAVRWIWGQRIVMAWVLTIPCSAFMAALAYGLIHVLVPRLVGQ